MKNRKSFSAFLVAATICLSACAANKSDAPTLATVPAVAFVADGWKVSVEALPQLVIEGTNPPQGVAGAFVEAGDGKIFVAGGALFPEKGPADGGKKKFYDTIRMLDPENSFAWETCAEKLPVPAAYGAAAGTLWVGGENENGKLGFDGAPAATGTLDNAAGAGDFVGGGNADGVPANKAWRRADSEWRALPDFPGAPRVQPVAGMLRTPRGNAFALVGGFYFDKATKTATLDRAGVIYYPNENRWEALPPLPESVSEAGLVGSCAVQDGNGGMLIFGGVNAKIFKDALENPAPDYLRHDAAWYKFNADVLRLSFDADGNAKWEKLATVPATARAGASAVRAADGSIYFVCGELKPGFRSPDCRRIEIRRAAKN